MIPGYNTDVRHDGVVFHVQTEDKGASNPFIETLLYVGGQVLAAKRASYANLLAQGKGDKAIVELMEGQHGSMIKAVRQGRFEEKLTALFGNRVPREAKPAPEADVLAATRATEAERTLDQVILEYLTNEANQEHLHLAMEGEVTFDAGQPAEFVLRTTSSKTGAPVPDAQVEVKMISTVAEPRSLASGATDGSGALALSFELPQQVRGSAALIITAFSGIGTAELKHLL